MKAGSLITKEQLDVRIKKVEREIREIKENQKKLINILKKNSEKLQGLESLTWLGL